MNNTTDTFVIPNTPEYSKHFWDYLRGLENHEAYLSAGADSVAYHLPTYDENKFSELLREQSLFRRIGTYLYTRGQAYTIRAKDSHDVAAWTDENTPIPVYDAINDFADIDLDEKKLAIVVKLDADFLHDSQHYFEKHLTEQLAKSFGKAENDGFLNGKGSEQPDGLLSSAEVGVTTAAITFDDVVQLFFSLDKDYRSNAAWLMNDETALALRLLKDKNGSPLWNHTNDTIFGKPVYICNEMPSAASGTKPVCFGDFSYFWVVERRQMSVRTLRERFFETDQIGYLAYEYLDGKLVRPDAVKALEISE